MRSDCVICHNYQVGHNISCTLLDLVPFPAAREPCSSSTSTPSHNPPTTYPAHSLEPWKLVLCAEFFSGLWFSIRYSPLLDHSRSPFCFVWLRKYIDLSYYHLFSSFITFSITSFFSSSLYVLSSSIQSVPELVLYLLTSGFKFGLHFDWPMF